MSVPLVWTEPFRVRAYEVGPDEHASVLTVCDYVQEAAGEHARAAGLETFDLGDGPGTWVLARLRLGVAALPALRERVTVVTWPAARDRLRAERDFVVYRGLVSAPDVEAGAVPDAERLVWGTSTWFVMNVARRRPVRLPEALTTFGPAERPRALAVPADEPTPPAGIAAEARFTVRRSDLDRVGHANNVRFAEWALEATERLPAPPGRLAALDLVFRSEAVAGDVVRSAVGPSATAVAHVGPRLAHQITRDADGHVLALAHSLWHA